MRAPRPHSCHSLPLQHAKQILAHDCNMKFALLLAALLGYVSADDSHTFKHIKTTSQSGSISPSQSGSVSQKVDHVIMMIIDGLRPDYMSGKPNFDWLMANGVCTMNARPDPVTSQTLPNHIDSKWRRICDA